MYLLAGALSLFGQPVAGYAAPELCAGCHQAIAQSYARTGMAQSFGRVQPGGADSRLTSGATFNHEPSAQTISVTAVDGKPLMERHQIGLDGRPTNVIQANIDYWFGSGNHARSYFSRTGRDELIELPLTWYSENSGSWAMSPGYDSSSHAGFTRKATYRCMFCHNAYPQVVKTLPTGTVRMDNDRMDNDRMDNDRMDNDRMDNGTQFPAALPQGIDCQRCHGPGQAHVDAAMAGRPESELKTLIVNPAALIPERRDEVCLQCHLEPTSTSLPSYLPVYGRSVFSYVPGEPLDRYLRYFDHAPNTGHDDKFEFAGAPYRLRQSLCFKANPASLTCTTCHDPHQPDKAQSLARAKTACLNCHRERLATLEAAGDSRHSTGSQCIACHMPERRPSDAIHVIVTDHYIRRNPGTAPDSAVELNSANTPPYRGEVVPYYPRLTPSDAAKDIYTGVAQLKNRANSDAGIASLAKAITAIQPAYPEFYADLADAYRHAGNSRAAIPYYREAITRDSKYWPAWHGLGLALAATGDLTGSLAPLRQALTLSDRESTVVQSLAAILTNMRKLNDALATLRDALTQEPNSAELRNDLGSALLRTGDKSGAEASLREALRLKPESAPIRLNLATLLAGSNRFDEARFEFQAAIRTDPASPAARYNFAVVLQSLNKLSEAAEQLAEALRMDPAYFAAHLKLGEILIAERKPSEALPHIRRAATSPDRNLSQYATALLKSLTP